MELTWLEKTLMHTSIRAWFQRRFEARRVLSDVRLGKDAVCLEVGCGNGVGALLIGQFLSPARIVAIDVDQDSVERARRYAASPPGWARGITTGGIEFACEDAAAMSFAEGTFDAAFLFGVLHHIVDWRGAIREVGRTLKPGGVFSFEEVLMMRSIPWFSRRFGHVPFGADDLREALTSAGFDIESFKLMRLLPGCFVRAVKKSAATE